MEPLATASSATVPAEKVMWELSKAPSQPPTLAPETVAVPWL